MRTETDVLIVGGGPAGLTAAVAARCRGLTCLVVDRLAPPIDKPCGEGLMPDALAVLHHVGVDLEPSHGAKLRGIRFTNGRDLVEAPFPDGVGLGVRRPVLHQLLIDRAETLGIPMRWRARLELIDACAARIDGHVAEFRWLIGADGLASHVRRWAGLEASRSEHRRYAQRRHYRLRPWSEFVEIHWGRLGQFYITPVSEEEVCVAFVGRSPRPGLDQALTHFPWIAERLSRAPHTSRLRGALSLTRTLRRVASRSVALVGDASGSIDVIAGEGLAIAFRQASALAGCLADGRLDRYQRIHEGIGARPQWMTRLMLTMDRWPAFGRRALPALARTPALFAELLAIHVGRAGRIRVLAPHGIELGWRLLTQGAADATASS
jgi:flavin-dependent dehydrogenase